MSVIESEAAYLTRRGFKLNAYKCLCCAVHGLSCLVTVHRGDVRHTVLFDTGPALSPTAVGKQFTF